MWLSIKKLFFIDELENKNRNFGLDLLRATAIILVVFCHGLILVPNFKSKDFLVRGTGYFGVELFFVISGFLIGSILLKIIDKYNYKFSFGQIYNFWIRRWFRTIPNYMLFLILNILIRCFWIKSLPFSFKYFFFLQNFAWESYTVMPESWSLAIEEWFYLTLPLVIWAGLYLPFSKKKSILISISAYIIFFTCLRFFIIAPCDVVWDSAIRRVVLYRLDAIGFGVLLAYFSFYYSEFIKKKSKIFFLAGLVLCIFTVYLFFRGCKMSFNTYLYKSVFFSVTSLFFTLMIPLIKEIHISKKLIRKIITYISLISYSVYLIHFSWVLPVSKKIILFSNNWVFSYFFYWVITLIVSALVYKFYESKMTALREKLGGRSLINFKKSLR